MRPNDSYGHRLLAGVLGICFSIGIVSCASKKDSQTAEAASPPNVAAAARRDVPVEGDVFIVTKGRENVRLALVEVSLLDEAAMNALVQERIAAVKAGIPEARKRLETAYMKNAKQRANCRREIAEYKKLGPPDAMMTDRTYIVASGAQQIARLCEKWFAADDAEMVAARDREIRGASALLATGVPQARATAKTDADGKFAFKVPAGKYGLVARSSRTVGQGEEEYDWLIWVNAAAPSARVMLSSDNLFGTDCKECAVTTADLDLSELRAPLGKPLVKKL